MADEKYINLHEMGTYMKMIKNKLAVKYVRKNHGHSDIQTNLVTALNTIKNTANNGVDDRIKILKDKLIIVGKTLLSANEANQLNALEEEIQSIMISQSNNMELENDHYIIRYNNELQSFTVKTTDISINVGNIIDLYKDIINTETMVPLNATSVPKYTIDDTEIIDIVPENFTLLLAKSVGVTELSFIDDSNAVTNMVRITVI